MTRGDFLLLFKGGKTKKSPISEKDQPQVRMFVLFFFFLTECKTLFFFFLAYKNVLLPLQNGALGGNQAREEAKER